MKPVLFVSCLALSFGSARAEPSSLLNQEFPLLMLADGTAFSNARITRIEPDAATITHPGGISRIALERFDEERRAALGYDPKAARKARAERKEQENQEVFAGIPPAYISNITPSDVLIPLTENGFVVSFSGNPCERIWSCSRIVENVEYEVEIYAPTQHDRVREIRCIALDHLHLNVAEDAQPLFELLVGILFEYDDPAPAEDWISGTILDGNGIKCFEQVTARMTSVSRNARLLRLSPM